MGHGPKVHRLAARGHPSALVTSGDPLEWPQEDQDWTGDSPGTLLSAHEEIGPNQNFFITYNFGILPGDTKPSKLWVRVMTVTPSIPEVWKLVGSCKASWSTWAGCKTWIFSSFIYWDSKDTSGGQKLLTSISPKGHQPLTSKVQGRWALTQRSFPVYSMIHHFLKKPPLYSPIGPYQPKLWVR